jgi:hypothetical protein
MFLTVTADYLPANHTVDLSSGVRAKRAPAFIFQKKLRLAPQFFCSPKSQTNPTNSLFA